MAVTWRSPRSVNNSRRMSAPDDRHRLPAPRRDPLRRARHAPAGAHRGDPQAARRDRRPADRLARDPALRRPGVSPLHPRDRLQGRADRALRRRVPVAGGRRASSASTPAWKRPRAGGSSCWRSGSRGEERFCATYSDGVADIDLDALLRFHTDHGALASMTVVRPELQFGVTELDGADGRVLGFREKPRSEHWINGGFFCLQRDALELPGARHRARACAARTPGRGRASCGPTGTRVSGSAWTPIRTRSL